MNNVPKDPEVSSETEDFAQSMADSFSSFLLSVAQEIARGGRRRPGSLAPAVRDQPDARWPAPGSARGANFEPRQGYQPDVGPESDLDQMRRFL